MLSILAITAVLLALPLGARALPRQEADTLRLRHTVETLASPEYDGRLLGGRGNREARQWLREQAREAGLQPLSEDGIPVQDFRVTGRRWSGLDADITAPDGRRFPLLLQSDGMPVPGPGPLRDWQGEAPPPCPRRELLLRDFNPAAGEVPSELRDAAAAAGAGALVLLPSPADEAGLFARYRQRGEGADRDVYGLLGDPARPPLFYGDAELRDALMARQSDEGWAIRLPEFEFLNADCGNLVYKLPVSSAGKPVVLLVAHFDHLGPAEGGFYPGANDNGSGVAVLLELARLLQSRRYPFQLRFLFSDGEEKGFLGARAYLAEFGAPDLAINLDTVGRPGVDHYRHLRDPEAYAERLLMLWTDRESPLSERLAAAAREAGFDLRSGVGPVFERAGDHFPFARRGVHSMFLFGGFHLGYHEVSDTPGQVLPGKLAGIVELLRGYLDGLAAESWVIEAGAH